MADQQPDISSQIEALGRDLTMDMIMASGAVYRDRQEMEPYRSVTVERDIQYGQHERHRLDVFKPENAESEPRGVFIFVHGGGFVRGDKRNPDSPYNDNVALWAMRHGMIGVNITYRYAPEFQFPCGAQDVAAAVAWVRANIAEHGGDPDRIFLSGTSAGAVHVAHYVAIDGIGSPETEIRGAVLLSCIFDPQTAERNDHLRAYYGDDPSLYAAASTLPGLLATKVPLLVTLAEYDPEDFEAQTLLFIEAWFEKNRAWPNFMRLRGHNHLTTSYHLNSGDEILGNELLRFVRDNG